MIRIKSIKLKNFKNFKRLHMTDIPSYCVLIGANGTGKTTLFDVFGFLQDCLLYNVHKALQARGGFSEVISRKAKTGSSIEIEIQFRMKIAKVSRLVTYILNISEIEKKPVITREILRYKRSSYGSPFHFLDFKSGRGYAITNEENFNKADAELEREEQSVGECVLAIKGLGQFKRFTAANTFRELVENWQLSAFHVDLARGSKDAKGFDDHLSATGDNLQRVAKAIYDTHRGIFDKIIEAMKRRVPGISKIEPVSTEDGRLFLRFWDEAFADPADSFIDTRVSDGTIKMFAYLIMLYHPATHSLLCVEEPENQLYLTLLAELAEEFRGYAERGGQVFVSTHSPDFLNAVHVEEVFWLIKKSGYAEIVRAKNNPQIANFMREGERMGSLWKDGSFLDL